jgi:hypothetical protein
MDRKPVQVALIRSDVGHPFAFVIANDGTMWGALLRDGDVDVQKWFPIWDLPQPPSTLGS